MTRKSDANRKYIERENLDAFLEHFAELDESMPTSVAHADKPDFILTFPDKAVGVEVTRSVAQEFVRAERLQAIHSPSSWINLTYLNDGDRRRSDAEIAASAFGMGWQPVEIGNRHWKAKITRSINTKRQKLNRPGQFYYFAKSSFTSAKVSDPEGRLPTIMRFLPFRNKHTAHRCAGCAQRREPGSPRFLVL
jgi:hypothetical protein